jgi:hypothetical protein
MKYKGKKKLIQVIISGIIWYGIYLKEGLWLWKTVYFKLWILPAMVVTAVTIIVPGVFAMGVSDWENANFLIRLLPVFVVAGIIYLLGDTTSTYSVVAVTTYFFGAVISYFAYVVAAAIAKRIHHKR